jgi:hypothetical protein
VPVDMAAAELLLCIVSCSGSGNVGGNEQQKGTNDRWEGDGEFLGRTGFSLLFLSFSFSFLTN